MVDGLGRVTKQTLTHPHSSSDSAETRHWSQKCHRNNSRADKKPVADLKKNLQIYEAEGK
jgi:hypothetical protein